MDDLKGKTLGRYKLLVDIGQGGMSTVYKARDLDTKKEVAVKVLTPYVAQEPKFRERFDREIRLLKDLEHAHIVPVLNYGEDEGITYIVMPFYSGGTLQDRIDDGGLGLDEVGRFMEELTGALQYAHDKGIVHRDIKPSNVLVDKDGQAMLSDFGFAYVSETSHSLTGSVLIGTPAFMSPEQCRGEEINARSDQYSLGAVLYQLTTGRLPFDGDTPMSVVIKHINDPLPRPRFLNPHLPDVLEAVIMKSMAKDPEDRYESMDGMNVAFAAGLEESIDPETGLARTEYIGPVPETQVIVHKERGVLALLTRNRVAAGAVMLVLLALPLTAFALNGGLLPGSSDAASSSETPTPSQFLLATIDALSTANAEALGGSEEPGAVETAVAATVEAMGLFDEPEATQTPTEEVLATSSPTPTSTNTPWFTYGNPTDPPDDDDPSGPPPPTSTSVDPTNTPLPEPTDAPPATDPPPPDTPIPPPPPTSPPEPTKQKPCNKGHPENCPPTP
jgi:serine/threonine protein kinase